VTPSIDWGLLAPEVIVTITLAVVFLVDLFVDDRRRGVLTCLTLVGLLLAFVSVVTVGVENNNEQMMDGAFILDSFALVGKGLFLASTMVVLLFGVGQRWKGEYLFLLLSSLLGMLLVVSTRDLLLFFVAFELFAIPGYLLTGWRKNSEHGHEGLLKYYLLGVLATAVMLYGISLLFGLAGGTSFVAINDALSDGGSSLALARVSVLFVLIGLAFKISAVPFHFWAPDAYQSAPIPVAAFLSVVTKAAGIFSFLIICAHAFGEASEVWAPIVVALSIVTMTAGNIAALRQTDLVRLLAYSSIAQAGYLLIPLAVATEYGGTMSDAFQASVEYLVIYAVTNLAAFGAVIAIRRQRSGTSFEDIRGLFATSPFLAVAFATSFFSLAGMPPFGGWFGKLVVLQAAIDANSGMAIVLVVIAAINTAIGLAYYANAVRQLWLPRGEVQSEVVGVPKALVVGLVMTTTGVLITGVLPGIVTYAGEWVAFAK
jgi:NADH-quinone oxidoreductase subunit N